MLFDVLMNYIYIHKHACIGMTYTIILYSTVSIDVCNMECKTIIMQSTCTYDWAILEQTRARSSINRLKVRRFDREGLHQLQYCIVTDEDLRGRNILPSICLYCYVSAQELPSHIFGVAMSLYQIIDHMHVPIICKSPPSSMNVYGCTECIYWMNEVTCIHIVHMYMYYIGQTDREQICSRYVAESITMINAY